MMTENTSIPAATCPDGLIDGILDVAVGLATAVAHLGNIESDALAAAVIRAAESTITLLTPPDYAAGRRLAAARIAKTLLGVGNSEKEGCSARARFEVILGGLAGPPKPAA